MQHAPHGACHNLPTQLRLTRLPLPHAAPSLPPPFPPPTGQKHVSPHLHIPGITTLPERPYAAQPHRQILHVAVAVSLGGGAYAKPVSGTKWAGHPVKQYENDRGRVTQQMGGEEYKEFLEEAWEFFTQQPGFQRVKRRALLVHVRLPVHKSLQVQRWLEERQLQSKLAPPRSPDLMPLDYGIFGTVKQQLGRELAVTASWCSRAERFMELLRKRPSSAVFTAFGKRLQACVQAAGGHFEK